MRFSTYRVMPTMPTKTSREARVKRVPLVFGDP